MRGLFRITCLIVAATLQAQAKRTAWDWKQCPQCGSRLTIKNGSYQHRPWFLGRRETVRVQRHLCHACRRSYSEQSALLVRGSWYAREVHRCAIDHWQHLGTSLRRTAEVLRSWMGRQERWRLWRRLFVRGQQAGLDLEALRGVTSDGAQGLLAYLRRGLVWVQQQRCVWHV